MKIFESEYRFMEILWENEPIRSGELAKLAEERLGWKPTTTYTVIKRLRDRGAVKSEKTVVRSVVGREEVRRSEIDELVEKKFDGSIPAFFASFARGRKLSDKDIDEMQKMIDGLRNGK